MLPNVPAKPNYRQLSDDRFMQLAAVDDNTDGFKNEKIKVELDSRMQDALQSLSIHQAYIDQLAALAKQVSESAKAAAALAEKPKQAGDREAALRNSFNAGKKLHEIARTAHADHQAFDGSWNEFRALNVGANAPNFPKDMLESFIRSREKIMGDGKLINVKVTKMEQLATRGEAFIKLSAAKASANQGPSASEAQDMAADLEKKLLDVMNKSMGSVKRGLGGGKNIGWVSVGSKINGIRLTAQQAKITGRDHATAKQYHVNMQAAVKTYKTTIKTMDTLIATTLKTIPANLHKAQGVATHLANAKGVRDEAALTYAEAVKVLAEADKLLPKIEKKVS